MVNSLTTLPAATARTSVPRGATMSSASCACPPRAWEKLLCRVRGSTPATGMPRGAASSGAAGGVAAGEIAEGASRGWKGGGIAAGCVNGIVSGTFGAASAWPGTKLPVLHNPAARQTIPAAKPSTNAASVFMSLFLQRGRGAGPDHRRQIERVPVGQPDAAVRGGVAYLARLRRTVNPVVFLGEIDPYQPDRIVRPRRQRLLIRGVLGVPEELRVVMKLRIAGDAIDFPVAHRQVIGFVANGGGVKGEQRAGGIVRAHRTLFLGDGDAARPRRRHDEDVRHRQLLAGLLEIRARIERLQQFRTGVKLLAHFFQRRRIPQVRQLRLLLHIGRYGLEGSLQVLWRDGVIDQRRCGIRLDRAPGGGIEYSGDGELPLALECGQRFLEVAAEGAIDLAAGKMRPGEQDLGAHHAGSFGAIGEIPLYRIVPRHGVDGDDSGVQHNRRECKTYPTGQHTVGLVHVECRGWAGWQATKRQTTNGDRLSYGRSPKS